MKHKIVIVLIALALIVPAYYINSTIDELGPLSFQRINNEVKDASVNNELWILDPKEVAIRLAGETGKGVDRTISVEEEDGRAIVTIIDEGYRDDSVNGAKYIINVIQDVDEVWYISSAEWGVKCQSGRGHQNYSTELCH